MADCSSNDNKCSDMKTTKTVRWEQTCALRLYERPSELDIANAWFDEEDYKTFKTQCKIVSKLHGDIGADTLETYCNDSCRGLEYFSMGKTYQLRKRRRGLAWDAVLEAQYQQNKTRGDSDGLDMEIIAAVYQAVSSDAQKDAHLKALHDAAEVQKIWASFASDLILNDDGVGVIKPKSIHLKTSVSSTHGKKLSTFSPVKSSAVLRLRARRG